MCVVSPRHRHELTRMAGKAYLRAHGREIADAPDPVLALLEATACITAEKATAWFRHAGYIWAE